MVLHVIDHGSIEVEEESFLLHVAAKLMVLAAKKAACRWAGGCMVVSFALYQNLI
jgi:hypothetical protein